MATTVTLRHKDTGITKEGFFGFSWTTLFFGPFPALFRGDFLTFIGYFFILLIVGFFTLGIGALFMGLIWAFMYNKYYTTRLLERGYMIADEGSAGAAARSALGVVQS